MSVRINVILPEETVRVLDRVAPKGNRSRLISDAVIHYVSSRGRSNLAEQLKAGALANAKRISHCEEWFPLEEKHGRVTQSRRQRPKIAFPKEVTSTRQLDPLVAPRSKRPAGARDSKRYRERYSPITIVAAITSSLSCRHSRPKSSWNQAIVD